MSDTDLKDDDIEIVEETGNDDLEIVDDGDGDKRLGDNAEDNEDDIVNGDTDADRSAKNAKKRKKQKELRKRARDNAERELQLLRQQNEDLMRRVQATEVHAAGTNVSQFDSQLAAVQNEIRQAEYVISKAVEAGNGEDVAAAIRLRDEATSRAQQLAAAKQQAEQVRQQLTAPRADPRVVSFAQEWHKANPWYNPNGADEHSLITKAVDNALAAEGWNPGTEAYWHELTKRVAKRVGGEENVSKDKKKDKGEKTAKRQAPPMGTDRESGANVGRNQFLVSKERKDAMIEAGVWDNPELRKRYLKAYQAYDRDASR